MIFLDVLDTLLFSDKYNEMEKSFVEYCVQHKNVFNVIHRLILPEHSKKSEQIGKIAKQLDEMRHEESFLVSQLRDVRSRKRKAQEDLQAIFASVVN